MDEAMKLAEKIARNAPIAVRATKKAINDGLQGLDRRGDRDRGGAVRQLLEDARTSKTR